jgi:hypothetical protein
MVLKIGITLNFITMNSIDTKQAVLKGLFENYQKNPTAFFDATQIIRDQSYDPHEFGRDLISLGLVKNARFLPNRFQCKISLKGIEEIAPDYLEKNKLNVISSLGLLGGKYSLMEILEYESGDFQKAVDISQYLENKKMILQSVKTIDDIMIELSIEGKEYFDSSNLIFDNM